MTIRMTTRSTSAARSPHVGEYSCVPVLPAGRDALGVKQCNGGRVSAAGEAM